MNWYYAEAGQQVGPVTEDEIIRLADGGKIQPDTLVWHEGLSNWQPFSYVKPAAVLPPPVLPEPTAAAVSAIGASEVVCVQCGKIVAREEAIAYAGNWVCANCKPLYFQKVKEGAALPVSPAEGRRYAGFWIRFCAKIIDGMVLGLVLVLPAVILFFLFFRSAVATRGGGPQFPTALGLGFQLLVQLGSIVVTTLYNWFFLSKYSATPGKMACGIKVITAAGAPLTSGQALGRCAAEILSGMTCDIGYIIAAFDKEKRALHDHIAGTRVVSK